jgi:hypothetical protein
MRFARLLSGLFAVCLINAMTFGAGRSVPDTAKIIPAQTMVLINISDANLLQKQFQNTNPYKLYKDPAMAPFINTFKDKWQQNLSQSQDEISQIIKDVNAIPSGRLAIAFILNEESKKTGEPTFLAISQWGKNFAAVKAAIDKVVKKAVDNGARRDTETVRGHQIITVTEESSSAKPPPAAGPKTTRPPLKPSPDEFADISDEEQTSEGQNDLNNNAPSQGSFSAPPAASLAGSTSTSYCFIDDTVMVAEDKEMLKFAIAQLEGAAGQSLADSASYQAAMAAVGPVHDIDLYVNVEQIIKTIAAQDTSGQAATQLANFGVDNVSALGAAASIGRKAGEPVMIKALLKINGAKKGIMKIVEPQNASLQVPRFVDASSVSLSVFNISIKNAYDELLRMMSAISPGFKAAIETPLVTGDENGQGRVELKKDILDYLGSQIVVASSIKKPFIKGSDPAKIITAIAVTDRTAIEKSLATWHNYLSQGKPDAKRELLGHTIYIMDMGSFPFMRPGRRPLADELQKTEPEMPKLAFTVTNTYLILGSEENVAQAIRLLSNKDAGSLTSAPWFVRAKAAIPGSVGIAALSDNRTYGEYIWWNLKELAKVKSGASDPAVMALSGLGEFFNFALLPDFNSVKKYFGTSVYYVVSRPEGYFLELHEVDLKAE